MELTGQMAGRSSGSPADRLALRDLAECYAAAVDARDAGLLASLFTADAVLTVYRADHDGPVTVYDGPAALPGLVRALAHRYEATFHLVGNHRSQVTGDTATAEAYCTAHHLYRRPSATPRDRQMLVRYADTCERGEDGQWRFRRRAVTTLWQFSQPVTGSVLDRGNR